MCGQRRERVRSLSASLSVSGRPGRYRLPRFKCGNGRPPKVHQMNSGSRKVQHNSFAHHRANLLFVRAPDNIGKRESRVVDGADATVSADRLQSLRERVSAGILGFVPAELGGPPC